MDYRDVAGARECVARPEQRAEWRGQRDTFAASPVCEHDETTDLDLWSL